MEGTDKARTFETFHEFIFTGDDDTENPHDVARLWSEYRSRIGFNNFPASAEAYLDDLMEIARDAA